jgi:hypothetical protein
MSNTIRLSVPLAGGAMLAAPRQVWLATLGAAAVTREWAQKEAGTVFRTLVREGSVVESRALSVVGQRAETSMRRASALAREAKHGVSTSIDALASFIRAKLPTVRARLAVDTAPPQKRAAKSVKRKQPVRRTKARATKQ